MEHSILNIINGLNGFIELNDMENAKKLLKELTVLIQQHFKHIEEIQNIKFDDNVNQNIEKQSTKCCQWRTMTPPTKRN